MAEDGTPSPPSHPSSQTPPPPPPPPVRNKHVQWAQSTSAPAPALDRATSVTSHELDEHGLDRGAFSDLRSRLEAHVTDHDEDHVNHNDDDEDDQHETRPPASGTDARVERTQDDPLPIIQIPGVFIDPNESEGLSEGLKVEGTDPLHESPSLPLPTQATTDSSRRRRGSGFLSVLGLHRQRQRRRDPPPLPALPPPSDSDTRNHRHSRRLSHLKGGGVLSALLALHDLDDTSLPATPRPDSPATRLRSRTRSRSSSLSTSASASFPQVSLPGLPKPKSQRPSTQRNGAGVFGALVAATGNITGAAAPMHSTLQPDIKARGYKISRYTAPPTPTTPALTPGGTRRAPPPPKISLPSGTYHGSASMPSSPRHESASGASSTVTHSPERRDSHPLPPSASVPTSPLGQRRRFGFGLGDLPIPQFPRADSFPCTPNSEAESDGGYFLPRAVSSGTGAGSRLSLIFGEKERIKDTRDEKKRKTRRTKAQIFITRHVAAVRARHDFLLRLARSMMMFGAPTHRLPSQLQATARVLDVQLSCVYLPDVMILAFDDAATVTSSVKLIRQGSALDLEKLQDAYAVYWQVIHDEISVTDATAALDALMVRKPYYSPWQLSVIGGFCSAAICVNSFSGSFIDALVSFPLGALLVAVQLLSVRNELFSVVFEMTIATLQSFLAAALASTHHFCYSAVASASVVLILPGFIVLSGSLEIANRSLVSGAVRLCYALMYSLFLGFGLAIGGQIFSRITNERVYGPEDYSCFQTHDQSGPWWQRTPSPYWAFLHVPLYSFVLSMRQQAPINRKELPILVLIACAGWTCNHFTGKAFPNQADISSAVGAFAVGVISNVYGRLFSGNAFVVMITGILFQLPSGLGNGGLLTFASDANAGSSNSQTYLSGFQTALQLVSVAIGLTVGLGVSLVVVHPIQSRKRAAGIFSL